jgi:hypothetical protein
MACQYPATVVRACFLRAAGEIEVRGIDSKVMEQLDTQRLCGGGHHGHHGHQGSSASPTICICRLCCALRLFSYMDVVLCF